MIKSKKESKKETLSTYDSPEVLEVLEEAAINQPSTPNRSLAIMLEGTPKIFQHSQTADLRVLQKEGIAADFGEAGWARGHKWRGYIRKG